jgi:dienelactone hydrolase
MTVMKIDAAVRYIKGQPMSNRKVGLIGYCLGGGIALMGAVRSNDVDAVNTYTTGPTPIP